MATLSKLMAGMAMGGVDPDSTKIPDTDVTIGSLVTHILSYHSLPSESCKLMSFVAEPLKESRGFCSRLLRLKLIWAPGKVGDQLPSSVIVKIPNFSKNSVSLINSDSAQPDSACNWLAGAHRLECDFFNLCAEELPMPMKVPVCYHAQHVDEKSKGLLVLEDLNLKGKVPSPYEALSFKQVMSVLEALAALHAWSAKQDFTWLQSKFPPAERGVSELFANHLRLLLIDLKSDWPDYFDTVIDPIVSRYCATDDLHYAYGVYEKFGLSPVLCHGDMWVTNLSFAREPRDDPTPAHAAGVELEGIIDWQFCHVGTAAEDLVQLLYTSITPELRKEAGNTFLRHYYRSLRTQLAGFPELVKPFQKILESYQHLIKYGLLFQLSLAAMLSKNEKMNNPGGHNDQLKELMRRCRVSLEDFLEEKW